MRGGVSDRIFEQARLMEIVGVRQKAALRRHLRAAHIRFYETNGRIWTTEEAINAPLVGRAKNNKGPNFDAITPKSSG
jgi:hypothetical protein